MNIDQNEIRPFYQSFGPKYKNGSIMYLVYIFYIIFQFDL